MTALTLVLALITLGVAAYAVFTKQTPVPLQNAVERFREANDRVTSGTREVAVIPKDGDKGEKGAPAGPAKRNPGEPPGQPGSPDPPASPDPQPPASAPLLVIAAPAEGVYRYTGSGSEQFGAVRRSFPRSSWRLVSHEDGNTWTEHHIFSEEREYWTRISTGPRSRQVHSQRHYIRIGPYEQQPNLTLRPPIPSALLPPEVGQEWSGVTNGRSEEGEEVRLTYECSTFERKVWEIGGRRIVVWGTVIDADLEGDYTGTLTVRRWFSPSYGLNVREEYYADVDLGPITYVAEWSVMLRSLEPET